VFISSIRVRDAGHFGVRECLHLAGAAALLLAANTASADELWAPIVNPSVDRMQPEYGWREVSGGVDAAGNQWLAYSGMTLAPLSPNIYSDGRRLRVGGGYGQYSYDRRSQYR
jgi:hypothetical protein